MPDDDDDSRTSSGGDSISSSSSSEEGGNKAEEGPSKKKAKTRTAAGGGVLASAPLEIAPSASSVPAAGNQSDHRHFPIIVVLDQATAETVKNRRGVYELLNCDDHRDYCKKKLRKDPNEFRPDILHQELLALLDSPLNKAGMLKVYVQTKQRVLIELDPAVRIPRTYKRFAGLMVQLLHKMKIKAAVSTSAAAAGGAGGGANKTLLKVIKNPVSQYLPAGARCFGMSCQGTLYRPMALARSILPPVPPPPGGSSASPPICFVIGAMSTGHVKIDDHPYIERMISISEYPLSGASAISRLLCGIEEHWGII